MTRLLRQIATTAALLLLAGCGAAPRPALAQNLVKNGDFAAAGNPPQGWVIEREAAAKGSVRVDAGVLELAPNSRNTPSDKPLGIGQAYPGDGLAGKTLQVRARLGLRSPASAAVIGLAALRDNGSMIGMVQLRRTEPGELAEDRAELPIPAGERPKLIILFAVAEGQAGSALFDDIVLLAGAAPAAGVRSGPPAAAAATAGAAYAASVSVDAAALGRTIPRGLYGVNIEWWRNANGLWDDKADRLHPEAVRLTRELGPTLIRFPGGFLGDVYNWKDGLAPRAQRPQGQGINPRDRQKQNFALGELLDFATQTGSDLLLSVNAGPAGTPELAGDWVRHMAARRGGPRALWWEVGNELYHKGDASGGALPPEDYAEKFLAFARAMRAADPQVRLGAIGLENYPTFAFNSWRDWNEVILRRLGGEIDFLAVHNGYAPAGVDDRADPRGVYQALLAAPRMVAENLRITAEQIRRFAPPQRAERIRIAVTEWAPLFHVVPSSPFIDHSKTLGSALYTADLLRVFLQNDKVEVATYFKLNEASFQGLLGVRGGTWAPTAPYWALQLYTQHFGETLVGASATSPRFDSPRAGIVPAMRDTPLLETVASVSADRRRLWVMLINKSLDQAAEVDLALNGFVPTAGTAHLLSGNGVDAHTGTELPRVPGLRWAEQAQVGPGNRHARGAAQEVALVSAPLPATGRSLRYRLPAHSVVSLELRR